MKDEDDDDDNNTNLSNNASIPIIVPTEQQQQNNHRSCSSSPLLTDILNDTIYNDLEAELGSLLEEDLEAAITTGLTTL